MVSKEHLTGHIISYSIIESETCAFFFLFEQRKTPTEKRRKKKKKQITFDRKDINRNKSRLPIYVIEVVIIGGTIFLENGT